MADIFTFPDIEQDRDHMTMAMTPRPEWDEERIGKAAAAFEMIERERQDDTGPRLVIRDAGAELEIFRTSDSIRWTLRSDREQEPDAPVELPSDERATGLADEVLDRRGLSDERAAVTSVTLSHHSRIGRGNEVLANYPVAKHVNYRFAFGGLPVFGPGAKISVIFADHEQPTQVYKFWRQPSEGDVLETIGYEEAVERIRSHRTFRTLREGGKASVEFDRARLGYYALPARERQDMLVPVYRFDGAAYGPEGEYYRFSRHVVAVYLSREETKRNRLAPRFAAAGVFSG